MSINHETNKALQCIILYVFLNLFPANTTIKSNKYKKNMSTVLLRKFLNIFLPLPSRTHYLPNSVDYK